MINLNKIANIINAISNPQQAISYALQTLNKKNPQQAQMINTMINSGKNPSDAIYEAARNGTINESQLSQLQSMYKSLKGLGVKISIPDNTWNEVKSIITQANKESNINTQQYIKNNDTKGF